MLYTYGGSQCGVPFFLSVKLKHFSKFVDMTDALSAATAAVEGKMSKGLKKVLRKVFASDIQEQLAVADAKLGSVIKVLP